VFAIIARAASRRASHGATAPIRMRFPNDAMINAGISLACAPLGGSAWTINASAAVSPRNSGQRHAPTAIAMTATSAASGRRLFFIPAQSSSRTGVGRAFSSAGSRVW